MGEHLWDFAVYGSGDEQIESYCGGRRLFVSRKGWIGLCPPGTLKWDQIWAVVGVKIPIMLRKVGDDPDDQNKLVGECYCHGLKAAGAEPITGPEETIQIVWALIRRWIYMVNLAYGRVYYTICNSLPDNSVIGKDVRVSILSAFL